MTTPSVRKRKAYLAIGGLGLVFSAAYLALSWKLPFGQMDQPGAALFPLVVGAVFVLASLATLHEGWQMDRSAVVELPAGQDGRRVLGLVGCVLAYLLLLPWLGHLVSSALFFVLLTRLLSNYTWPRIAVYSLALALGIHGVFVYLLKVPMPKGMLGF